MSTALLKVEKLSKVFGNQRSLFGRKQNCVHAVTEVSLTLQQGEILGIVGESGCGKSTLAKMMVSLVAPTEGSISFQGAPIHGLKGDQKKAFFKKVQYIFQDPLSSLNPKKTVRQVLDAPLKLLLQWPQEKRETRMRELMNLVNLNEEFLDRYPHEFSGGQRQRICIAKALAAEPELLILDEPVSALDVSIQAQILNLLKELKQRLGLTYVFISHDLAVVEKISDLVAVMYLGRIVESGPCHQLFQNPLHPYTKVLLSSIPQLGKASRKRVTFQGEPPDPSLLPTGCGFYSRCQQAEPRCKEERPELNSKEQGQRVACFLKN